MSDILGIEQSGGVLATIKAELEAASPSRRQRILEAIALAALGSIPWVGGVLSAAATFKTGEAGVRQDDLRTQWLQEHQHRLEELRATLGGIFARVDNLSFTMKHTLRSFARFTRIPVRHDMTSGWQSTARKYPVTTPRMRVSAHSVAFQWCAVLSFRGSQADTQQKRDLIALSNHHRHLSILNAAVDLIRVRHPLDEVLRGGSKSQQVGEDFLWCLREKLALLVGGRLIQRRGDGLGLGAAAQFLGRPPIGAASVQRIEDDVAPALVVKPLDELARRVVHDCRMASVPDLKEKLKDQSALANAGVPNQFDVLPFGLLR